MKWPKETNATKSESTKRMYERRRTKISIGSVRIDPERSLPVECTIAIVKLLPLRCYCVCTWCSLNVKNGWIFVICKTKLFDFCFYFRNRKCTQLHTHHELMGNHWLTGLHWMCICLHTARMDGRMAKFTLRVIDLLNCTHHIYSLLFRSFSHSHFVIPRTDIGTHDFEALPLKLFYFAIITKCAPFCARYATTMTSTTNDAKTFCHLPMQYQQ